MEYTMYRCCQDISNNGLYNYWENKLQANGLELEFIFFIDVT